MTAESSPSPEAATGWHARALHVGSVGRAAIDAIRRRRSLAHVERFCFFIGYARSGSTLVGAMLNAHPEVVIANELDVLHHVELGTPKMQIFSLLLQQDRLFTENGLQWTGYDYAVPGQSQGTFTRLRVLGDKRAGRSTHRLGAHPELLDALRRTVDVPLRVIHVVRNPYDNITTMAAQGTGDLPHVTGRYRRMSAMADEVRAGLDPEELIDVRYESFVERPREQLRELCRFLGVEPSPAYLEACAARVSPSPSRSRDRLPWSADERRAVEELIGARPVLHGYEFDS